MRLLSISNQKSSLRCHKSEVFVLRSCNRAPIRKLLAFLLPHVYYAQLTDAEKRANRGGHLLRDGDGETGENRPRNGVFQIAARRIVSAIRGRNPTCWRVQPATCRRGKPN